MSENLYKTITACRLCGSEELTPLFSLGEQYVSDFPSTNCLTPYLHPAHAACNGQPRIKIPIDIVLCRQCTLVQQKHTTPQDFMYSRHYWYRSNQTNTMVKALRDITQTAERIVGLEPGDIVLDIGSNTGDLLRSYTSLGEKDIIRVGVEPASNLQEEGKQGLDLLINDFWSANSYYRGIREIDSHGMAPNAKVITAIGMLYDLDDPNSFISDIARVLRPDGIFIAQLMCLKQTLETKDVGNFCHEHLEFYSLPSISTLLALHGLVIFDIEENQVNGGSYRIYICHKGNPICEDHQRRMRRVSAYMAEGQLELQCPETHQSFFQEIERVKEKIKEFVSAEYWRGKRIYVLGASTKGNVLLQWWGLDSFLIEAAVERSPEKVGKFTVGTNIPIISEEEFRRRNNCDYALVLPYAFLDEIMLREKWVKERGGKFIVPLPQMRVV